MSTLVTVIVKSHAAAAPANVWTGDDGKSNGPTKGTGSNGGTVQQINLHEGVNTGVSSLALAQYLATVAGKALLQAGSIAVHA